ncbi:Uncharacterised protein [Burkholderia pseudomallei]|nr:Uncharacterised protein [Burkholderia pseudomallei]CAJ5167987.1 Uncharacterised protein [Burkholderia pseudomallei]CAJ5197174.1 Uncharacterised protein [Burkholderia pseudomallei]CAJ5212716.1 Uncharacterised protein [Burkholderia pseudomallei]CAJ5213097.1 Uncharacterised protein [Burkholderia pseudomallei]
MPRLVWRASVGSVSATPNPNGPLPCWLWYVRASAGASRTGGSGKAIDSCAAPLIPLGLRVWPSPGRAPPPFGNAAVTTCSGGVGVVVGSGLM